MTDNITNSPSDEEFTLDKNTDTDDIIIEADDSSSPVDKLKKLRQELKETQKEKQEYLAGWQRAKADYLNYKKEEESRRGEVNKFAKADILNDLIRLADSFDMAFANKSAWENVPENWRKGVEYIHSQLLVVFRDHGLEEIDPQSEIFDPARDESIGVIKVDKSEEDNKIIEVVKKGYRLNGRIIRPAQVKVGSYQKN